MVILIGFGLTLSFISGYFLGFRNGSLFVTKEFHSILGKDHHASQKNSKV